MLERAGEALAAEPELEARVRLVRGELERFALGQRFGLALVGLDSFGLLVGQEQQLAALACLRGHLRRKALLALDLANGNLRGGEAGEETTLHRRGPFGDGGQLQKWVARWTDHARQVDRLLHLYDEVGPDGAVRRTSVELELRYFTRFELELLLERAGFVVEALFGDYELAPYGPGSQRLIAIAHVR